MLLKNICIALLALGCTTNIFAGPWDADSTPVQVFKQAAPEEPEGPVIATKNVEPPKVAPAPAVKAAPPSKPSVKVHPKAISKTDQDILQAELTQINQNNILYEQANNARLETIQIKMQQLQQQIRQLDQALLLINQEVSQLAKTTQGVIAEKKAHPNIITLGWVEAIYNILGPIGFYIFLGAVALGLMGLSWMLFGKRSRKGASGGVAPKNSEENDTQDEYDYMGSRESTPAKLNLARAYIAMEDYAAAKKVILDVIGQGDDQQRQEAEELLREVPQT